MKKWLLSLFLTPKRVRKVVANVISWLIYQSIAKGAWGTVLSCTAWLRKLADFIESWNATVLPKDKDQLISDLVAEAITDEAVDKLLERVAAMEAERLAVLRGRQVGGSVVLPELPASKTTDV